MNAEMVGRLDFSFENALTNKVLLSISKRLSGTADALQYLLLGAHDLGLETFIADQREKGVNLTQTEAIRFIVCTYLTENGYVYPRGGASGGSKK